MKTFYLYKEQLKEFKGDYECTFLTPKDMILISPDWKFPMMLFSGHRCYAIKEKGTVIAYNWINMKFIEYYGFKRSIKQNEAFLYSMFVREEHRGKGIAEYLRYKTLEMLQKTGRDTFYSITDCDNKPALRFKEKIEAKKICKAVYLFKKSFIVKWYDKENKGRLQSSKQKGKEFGKVQDKESCCKEIETS